MYCLPSISAIDLLQFDSATQLPLSNGLYSDIEMQEHMQRLQEKQMHMSNYIFSVAPPLNTLTRDKIFYVTDGRLPETFMLPDLLFIFLQ